MNKLAFRLRNWPASFRWPTAASLSLSSGLSLSNKLISIVRVTWKNLALFSLELSHPDYSLILKGLFLKVSKLWDSIFRRQLKVIGMVQIISSRKILSSMRESNQGLEKSSLYLAVLAHFAISWKRMVWARWRHRLWITLNSATKLKER